MFEIKTHDECPGAKRWLSITKITIEGNIAILTSKSYFMAIDYCPWCGLKLIEENKNE